MSGDPLDLTLITAAAVKDVLESTRLARSLGASALIGADMIAAHLRDAGVGDSIAGRQWALAVVVHDTISRQYHRVGGKERKAHDASSQEEALRQLRHDFASGRAQIEAWSALFYRYVVPLGGTLEQLARLALPDYDSPAAVRRVQRRIERGCAELAMSLIDVEVAAQAGAHRPSVPVGTTRPAPAPPLSEPLGMAAFLAVSWSSYDAPDTGQDAAQAPSAAAVQRWAGTHHAQRWDPFGPRTGFVATFTTLTDALAAGHGLATDLDTRDPPSLAFHVGHLGLLSRDPQVAVEMAVNARAGQWILSATAVALLGDATAVAMDVRTLGNYNLAACEAPQRLFIARMASGAAADLPLGFPLIAACDWPGHHGAMIGREIERDSLAREWTQTRLITLSGPSGVGKSRLAAECARAAAGVTPDEAVWIGLEDVASDGAVAERVGTALGLRPADVLRGVPSCSPLARVRLIVLDNCEHVREGTAAVVAALLAHSPAVRCLVTSQVPLGLASERTIAVEPLAVPVAGVRAPPDQPPTAAEALFLARLQSPPNAPAPDRDAIARICRAVDGLPLAIELIASQAQPSIIPDIANSIEAAMFSHGVSETEQAGRHRTLDAAIGASVGLLAAGDLAILKRVAVFGGSWSARAAGDLCADFAAPGTVTAGVLRLVQRSLVQAEATGTEPRYRLLAPIRTFMRRQLQQSGDEAAAYGQLVAWCRRLVDVGAAHADEVTISRRLAVEGDNLRAAADWSQRHDGPQFASAAVGIVFSDLTSTPLLRHAPSTAAFLLAAGNDGDRQARARACFAAGDLASADADWESADRFYRSCLAELDRAVDPRTDAIVADRLGLVAQQLGTFVAAAEWHHRARDGYRAASDRPSATLTAFHCGLANYWAGRTDSAIIDLKGAVDELRQVGDRPLHTEACLALGHALMTASDSRAAEAAFEEARACSRSLGDTRGVARALLGLASCARAAGHTALAQQRLTAAERLYANANDALGAARCQLGLAWLAFDAGRLDRSRAAAEAVFATAQSMGSHALIADVLHLLARTDARDGWSARAVWRLAAAARIRADHVIPRPPEDVDDETALLGALNAQADRRSLADAWEDGWSLAWFENGRIEDVSDVA